jgi:putative ABC transport system permease protein
VSAPNRSACHLLIGVLGEGAVIAGTGLVAGVVAGLALARFAGGLFGAVSMPGALTIAAAAAMLMVAAILASLLPAARASRVDALTALRAE